MTKHIKPFKELVNDYFSKLDLFTTAITRAHGKSHPEAFDVREIFEVINSKVEATESSKPNLNEEFSKLREITNNYTIPEDVCETYEGVYNMLSELDESYHA